MHGENLKHAFSDGPPLVSFRPCGSVWHTIGFPHSLHVHIKHFSVDQSVHCALLLPQSAGGRESRETSCVGKSLPRLENPIATSQYLLRSLVPS